MTRTTVLGHDYTLTEQGYRHCEDCKTCFAIQMGLNDREIIDQREAAKERAKNSEGVVAFHPAQVEAYPELKERLKRDALYQAELERACGCCEPEAYDYE